MIEILKFIFSSFWIFTGTVILLSVIISPFVVFARSIAESEGPTYHVPKKANEATHD